MLSHIRITGLAIIEELAIDFGDGFNVITGETGAGKSILIKALQFLLGGKSSVEMVRSGWDQATVSGQFCVPVNHPFIASIEKLGILSIDSGGDDGEPVDILIRRTLTSKGRSSAWINDTPISLQSLKNLSETLVDIFAQHENQRLLDPALHTYCLDQFLPKKDVLKDYDDALTSVETHMVSLRDLASQFGQKNRELDYLKFRCDELNSFDPSEDNYNHVLKQSQSANYGLQLSNLLQKAQGILDSGYHGESLGRPLKELGKILMQASQFEKRVEPLVAEINQIAGTVSEVSFEIGRVIDSLEVNEEDLEAAQQRLAGYQSFFRKLNVKDCAGLIQEHDRLSEELRFIDSAGQEARKILNAIAEELKKLIDAARKLSDQRKLAAKKISQLVNAELHELAMKGSSFSVGFQESRPAHDAVDVSCFGQDLSSKWSALAQQLAPFSAQGAERAQFLLSSNPGEPALPLQKIASGGEVSRIMLAIKKALSLGANTCLLVFDEIDTGISGRVADVVGRKLQELSSSFQVICISHLPQVAAYADAHFLVHKFGKKSRTESTISKLSPEQSVEELARLLSGPEITKSSLENAKALIGKAKGL